MLGYAVNLFLRGSIAYYLIEVLRNPNDPRFAGKALPVRNLVVVGSLSLLFPVLQFWRRQWPRYPVWDDNLYLSIFWFDMVGNSLDLYERLKRFDLVAHFHGAGALTAVLASAFRLPWLTAFGLATIIHVLLEAQENYTEILFRTRNIKGLYDTINDLTSGLVGSVVYLLLLALGRRLRQE
jgi:predicted permease